MKEQLLLAFKRYMDVEETDTSQDDILSELLDYVEDFIYSSYGVSIYDREVVDILSPYYGDSVVFTNDGYIREVVEMTVDGINVATEDLFFKRNKIKVLNGAANITDTSTINIIYRVGYTNIEDVKGGLLNALFSIAKKVWNDSIKDTDALSSVSIGIKEGIKVSFDLPLVATQTLESHKMYRL